METNSLPKNGWRFVAVARPRRNRFATVTLEDWLQSRREGGSGIEGIIFVIPSEVEESLA